MATANAGHLDRALRVLAFLLLLGAAVWAFTRYRADHRRELDRADAIRHREHTAGLLERQTQLYFDATRSAATLASSHDARELRDAGERWSQLYLGELRVVEDRRVELAMDSFQHCLQGGNLPCSRAPVNRFGQHFTPEQLGRMTQPNLKDLAIELAVCTRSALEERRHVRFAATPPTDTLCTYDLR